MLFYPQTLRKLQNLATQPVNTWMGWIDMHSCPPGVPVSSSPKTPPLLPPESPPLLLGAAPVGKGGAGGEGQIIENEQHDQLVPGLRVLKPTRTAPHRTAPLSLSVCKYPFSTPELLYCNFSEHRDASVIANSGTNKIVREKCK